MLLLSPHETASPSQEMAQGPVNMLPNLVGHEMPPSPWLDQQLPPQQSLIPSQVVLPQAANTEAQQLASDAVQLHSQASNLKVPPGLLPTSDACLSHHTTTALSRAEATCTGCR